MRKPARCSKTQKKAPIPTRARSECGPATCTNLKERHCALRARFNPSSAALEGAPSGVRVNAVAPGPVETEMLNRFTGGDQKRKSDFLERVPLKRAATPQEIADTILFVACKVPFLTGQSIVIDGGITAA